MPRALALPPASDFRQGFAVNDGDVQSLPCLLKAFIFSGFGVQLISLEYDMFVKFVI